MVFLSPAPPLWKKYPTRMRRTLRFGAQVIRTLAFNDRDKVVKDELVAHDCIAPLILLMRSANEDDQCIAVGAIGNLVHSCNAIKQRVLEHGGLQPVIALLKGKNPESRKEAALLVGQFANVTNTLVANDDTWKVKIAQRAAIPPLVTVSGARTHENGLRVSLVG